VKRQREETDTQRSEREDCDAIDSDYFARIAAQSALAAATAARGRLASSLSACSPTITTESPEDISTLLPLSVDDAIRFSARPSIVNLTEGGEMTCIQMVPKPPAGVDNLEDYVSHDDCLCGQCHADDEDN
jgi:hypothetical protein